MSSDVAISVRGVSKSYKIRHNQASHTTLGEALVHRFKHPFERSEREEFWALNDLSFDVKQGEVLGVIGRNGAGKSTLLKILSRITAPTKGEIDIYGRVGSLLEVGTGFHPELTGRENIYLNGSILGMRRKEIDHRFDEIVDFAGVEQFLDTPVKRYSSGMYVRLAFAVAAHMNSEILLIDEVLAVGDSAFQSKSIRQMQEVARQGRSVVFVSHQLSAVRALCDRVAVLEKGVLMNSGDVSGGIEAYVGLAERSEPYTFDEGNMDRPLWLQRVRVTADRIDPFGTLAVEAEVGSRVNDAHWVSIHLVDSQGVIVYQCDGRLVAPLRTSAGSWRFLISDVALKPGRIRVDVFVLVPGQLVHAVEGAAMIEVTTHLPYPNVVADEMIVTGAALPRFEVRFEGTREPSPSKQPSA